VVVHSPQPAPAGMEGRLPTTPPVCLAAMTLVPGLARRQVELVGTYILRNQHKPRNRASDHAALYRVLVVIAASTSAVPINTCGSQ
jgi:hypothetical protein